MKRIPENPKRAHLYFCAMPDGTLKKELEKYCKKEMAYWEKQMRKCTSITQAMDLQYMRGRYNSICVLYCDLTGRELITTNQKERFKP